MILRDKKGVFMSLINRMFICLILVFSTTVRAEMIEGIEPVLKYDKHYHLDHKRIESQYLVIVPEEWTFPAGDQKVRFERALEILPDVMNSERFKLRVLSYINSKGKREYQKPYLWNNKNEKMTNEEIYNLIMVGDERMRPDTIGEMNINSYVKICTWFERNIRRARWCRGVIGSTNPHSSKWIALNWKFYRNYKSSQMVANLVHEWLHLLGFLHGNENMREEVPYVVGSIAGQVAAELLAEGGIEN